MKCPYCGWGIYPEDDRVYDCGTLVGATAPETGLCHSGYEHQLKTELAALNALVREIGKVGDALTDYSECIYDCSIAPTYEEVRDSMLEILDRPNVRAVMRENQVVDSGYTSTITSGSSNPPDRVRFPRKEEEE